MIEIDYSKSKVEKIGNFGFELTTIEGRINDEKFIITISESPTNKNSPAALIKGNLTESEITEVLKQFNYLLCE